MNPTTYYGNKKYRYIGEEHSLILKENLPKNWPDIIIEKVKKNQKSYSKIPSKTHLYALVNGRVKNQEFLPLVLELARTSKNLIEQIRKEIKELSFEINFPKSD